MVSCCNRRLYKGNSYEICLPITDTGVTSVKFYTSGDMVIEKEGEIVDDKMCFELTKEELDLLPDGVLRYSYEGFDSNTEYVIVTPADYSGSTLDDLLEDAFDSGYTAGQEDCSGSSCNLQSSKTVYLGGFEWSYDPGTEGPWARAPRYMISGSPVYISADTGYDGLEEIQLTGYFHPTEAYDDGYGKGFTSGYTAGQEDCSGDTCNLQDSKIVRLHNYEWTYYPGRNGHYGEYQLRHNPEIISADTGYDGMKEIVLRGYIDASSAFTDGFNSGYSVGQETCSGETPDLERISIDLTSFFKYWPESQTYSISGSAVPYCVFPDSGYDGLERVCIYTNIDASEAISDGYQSGYTSGYSSGYEEGLADCSGSTTDADLIANLQGDYFVIPEGTTRLRDWAFRISQNNGFSGIVIPNSVLYIGQYAFHGNFRLKDITIPSSVESIGNFAFNECSGLTAMTFEGVTPPRFAPNYPLGSSAYTFPIYVPCESVEAYKTAVGQNYAHRITCAGPEPQSAATAITITVPQNLEPGDTGSTSVSTSPTGATTNLSYSSSDNSVATVDNNGNITAVGTGTTNICVTDSISQITECVQLTVNNSLLGEGDVSATVLPRLSTSAVPLCSSSNLGSVSKMAIDGVEITPVSAYTFGDTNLHTLDVWYLSSTIPYDAFEYADRLKDVVIKDRMTVIGGRAFYWCTGITSVHIGSGITTINNSAFQGDKSLTAITIPDSVSTLGSNVFMDCTSLTAATLGTGITAIGHAMFSNCSGLTDLTINGVITEIGANSFSQCSSLSAYSLTNDCTTIYQSAFANCVSLISIDIPDSVTLLAQSAFEGCTNLTGVTIGTGITQLNNNVFKSCGALQSVSIPDSVISIGEGSFEGCSAMTTVVFGSGITEIGDYAFQNCSYLRGIDIPETITKFGAYSFRNDVALQVYGITIRNASVPQVGNQAFASTDDAPIYVPAGSVEAYKTSTTTNYYWATYANRIQAIQ